MTNDTGATGRLSRWRRWLAAAMRATPVGFNPVWAWRERIYRRAGGGPLEPDAAVDRRWPQGLQAAVRGKLHGYRMRLDLSDWAERRAYHTGRFYQEGLEDLFAALLRPGDRFVDVGANIGMLTLHAARLVKLAGRVWSFEPNPPVHRRLLDHVTANRLDTVSVHRAALGEAAGTLTLRVPGDHSGVGSLVDVHGGDGVTWDVPVQRGDDMLPLPDGAPVLIKLDVEGFEALALRGMPRILADPDICLVIEVTPHWLAAAGTPAHGMFDHLAGFGFEPWGYRSVARRYGRAIELYPEPAPLDVDQYDCVFLKRGSRFWSRAEPLMRPA